MIDLYYEYIYTLYQVLQIFIEHPQIQLLD